MKKYFVSLMFFACLLLSALGATAAETARIPACTVILNGTELKNDYRQFPLLQYRDIVYFPMTYYDCRFLGIDTLWDGETSTLQISRKNITCAYRSYDWQWKNSVNNSISVCRFNVTVNGRTVDNSKEKYPLITFRDVTYFPLTWAFAVDDFGWSYSYTRENGLIIESGNYSSEILSLPDAASEGRASAATDGKYYYYKGNGERVYRTPVDDISKYEVIHTLPENYITSTTPVHFSEENGKIYMTYHIGGASMGSDFRYRINPDGTLTETDEGTVSQSGIGYNRKNIQCEDMMITVFNQGHADSTVVSYTKNGTETNIALEGVRFGEKRLAGMGEWDFSVSPQALGSKIYVTGYTQGDNSDSRLYCIDADTGAITPLIEGVGNFFAFIGWDNTANCDSHMIIYYREGKMRRFSASSGQDVVINENSMPLKSAVYKDGLYLYTGNESRSAVEFYDGCGVGSIRGAVLFETNLGTDAFIAGGMLCTVSFGEGEDIHTAVFNNFHNPFFTSDTSQYIFIHDDTLIYSLWDSPTLVKVDLKKGAAPLTAAAD